MAAPAQSVDAAQLIGFRRHLLAEVVAGEAAYLFSERGFTALAGSHIEALAPLLDGTRDLEAVLREIPGPTTEQQALDIIQKLIKAGLVGTRPRSATATDEAALAYWDTSGMDAAPAAARIETGRLRLVTLGNLDRQAAAAALDTAGLTVGATEGDVDLSIVLCADYLDPALATIDAEHRSAGRPWLLAKPGGATVWIGPIFESGTACWHCLAGRLASHRQMEGYVQVALGRNGPVPRAAVTLPSLTGAAMNLIALEASKWLAGYRYPSQQSVWTFDSLDLRGRHHELRARPQCPACGDPSIVSSGARRPVALGPRRKACYTGGGHRSMLPEQVLDSYQHLVSPVTGVIKEIGRDRRGPAFFNSFRSGPNLAIGGARNLLGLKSTLRLENGGKGTTALDAEVGAMCEAIERHCGSFHGDEERVRGSLRSLGDLAIDPNSSMLFADRQYAGRAAWNPTHSAFQFVCSPVDENAVMDWSPVWSLTQQRHRLLPTNLLYFGAPAQRGPLCVRADSNGNAAGSSLEDAVLQGLFEVIERDAVALWWYNRTRMAAVDLDAFDDPWVDELRGVYADLGREVWVLDVTSDLRVPAMVALSRRTDTPGEVIVFGCGSHSDPKVALRRALTEMNQLLPAMNEAACATSEYDGDPDASHWLRYATVENQPYLLPDPTVRPRTPRDYGYVQRHDLAEDIDDIKTKLEALGLELLVLDQTRPDIGMPVVKVIVPGMRHFWARYAPGRLYDVPVRLGRLARPTPYEELNPIPLFV